MKFAIISLLFLSLAASAQGGLPGGSGAESGASVERTTLPFGTDTYNTGATNHYDPNSPIYNRGQRDIEIFPYLGRSPLNLDIFRQSQEEAPVTIPYRRNDLE